MAALHVEQHLISARAIQADHQVLVRVPKWHLLPANHRIGQTSLRRRELAQRLIPSPGIVSPSQPGCLASHPATADTNTEQRSATGQRQGEGAGLRRDV